LGEIIADKAWGVVEEKEVSGKIEAKWKLSIYLTSL